MTTKGKEPAKEEEPKKGKDEKIHVFRVNENTIGADEKSAPTEGDEKEKSSKPEDKEYHSYRTNKNTATSSS